MIFKHIINWYVEVMFITFQVINNMIDTYTAGVGVKYQLSVRNSVASIIYSYFPFIFEISKVLQQVAQDLWIEHIKIQFLHYLCTGMT